MMDWENFEHSNAQFERRNQDNKNKMFSMRLVTSDYYCAAPIYGLDPLVSHFRGSPTTKVPVYRIFGATPSGENILCI